jgi:glutamate carboxypeptidase
LIEHPRETVADRVLGHLRARRDDFVSYVEELLRAESPSTEPRAFAAVHRALQRGLDCAGCRVTHVPGRRSAGMLFALPRERKRGRAFQLVAGHCDTVWPTGTLREMPVQMADGKLRGPGVFDLKGGLALAVFALHALAALDLEPEVTPAVLVTSDEEIGSIDSQSLIERLARRADRALVLEPALGLIGKLKTARKGTGHFDVVVRGRASHAGIAPEEGASAILELSHVIQKLFALNDPNRGITVNVGTVSGGLRSNVVAPESRAVVDARVLTWDDARGVERAVAEMIPVTPGVTIEISGGFDRSPMEATPRNQALWRLARNLGADLGVALEEGTSGGASDGNITSLYTATLDGLGPVGDGAHAKREYIDIDRTLERCALLALILLAPPVRDAHSPPK